MKFKLISTTFIALSLTACATTSVQEPEKAKADRTKVAANMQEVKLTSSPDGASCTVSKDAETLGSLPATPGYVTIKRSNFSSVEVTCSKTGFNTTTEKLRTIVADKALGGNIGALITIAKAAQGSLSSYEDSLFIKLEPSYFNSSEARENYLDDEISLLNNNFSNASKQYLTCKKKKCVKKLAELQSNYDAEVATLKAKVSAIPLK